MEYKPSLPQDNHNITHTPPSKEFVALLGGVLGLIFVTYIVLGFFVDFAVEHISPEVEHELFRQAPVFLLPPEESSADPRQKKLQQLIDDLKSCVGISVPITVHIKESEMANAMALPGGHIVVFSGLLDKLDSENGIAFVLGHELGHFTNRDHLRGLGRGIVLTVLAATVTGANSNLSQLLTPSIQLSQANYSQGREALADQTGMRALYCQYGHVGGATEFFEKMSESETTGYISHYFSTHPEMRARISILIQQAQENGWEFKNTVSL